MQNETKYKHDKMKKFPKYKHDKIQKEQNTNCQNTNVTKYKCNKIQMEQNTNRTECKNTKIQPPYRPLPLLLRVSLLAQAFSDPVADLTR